MEKLIKAFSKSYTEGQMKEEVEQIFFNYFREIFTRKLVVLYLTQTAISHDDTVTKS